MAASERFTEQPCWRLEEAEQGGFGWLGMGQRQPETESRKPDKVSKGHRDTMRAVVKRKEQIAGTRKEFVSSRASTRSWEGVRGWHRNKDTGNGNQLKTAKATHRNRRKYIMEEERPMLLSSLVRNEIINCLSSFPIANDSP